MEFTHGEYAAWPPAGAQFNLEVTDVGAWWERLGHDCDVLEPLLGMPHGTREFAMRDPDGDALGFVQDQQACTSALVKATAWRRKDPC